MGKRLEATRVYFSPSVTEGPETLGSLSGAKFLGHLGREPFLQTSSPCRPLPAGIPTALLCTHKWAPEIQGRP